MFAFVASGMTTVPRVERVVGPVRARVRAEEPLGQLVAVGQHALDGLLAGDDVVARHEGCLAIARCRERLGALDLVALVGRGPVGRRTVAAVDDRVLQQQVAALTRKRAFRVTVRIDVRVAGDAGHVADRGRRERRGIEGHADVAAGGTDVVALDAAVAVGLVVDHEGVRDRTDVAVGIVERIVTDVECDRVGDVHGAAKELEAIVIRAVGLHVLDHRARADRVERDAIQLAIRRDLEARVLDDDVAQDARILRVVAAAVMRGLALGQHVAGAVGTVIVGAIVGDAVAVDDDAAPLGHVVRAGRVADRVREGREGDRRSGRSLGDDSRPAIDQHVVSGILETPACYRPRS